MKYFHNILVKGLIISILAAGISPSRADTEPHSDESERLPADVLLDSVVELIEILDKHGLHFDPEAIRRQTMETLIQAADPLGRFITEPDKESIHDLQRGISPDIGIQLKPVNDGFEVMQVREGGPSYEAEISVGDRIIGIQQSEADLLSLNSALRLIRQDSNDPAHLKVRYSDGSTDELSIKRKTLELPAIEIAETLPNNIGYIRINALLENSGAELADRLKQWKSDELYGLVMDLRGAGGDNLDSVSATASLFAESGTKLFTLSGNDDQDITRMSDNSEPLDMPTMVLVDGGTSGASEILAATLKGSGHGVMLFGQTSKGDFMTRDILTMSTGEQIYIATRRLKVADGTRYDGQHGIRPHVQITREHREHDMSGHDLEQSLMETREEDEHRLSNWTRDDAALRRSVDVLLGLKALNIETFGRSTHNVD